MQTTDYPGISERIKSIIIDSFVPFAWFLFFTYLFDTFQLSNSYLKLSAFIFIILLFEPLMVSQFGGSVGHFFVGIRVKNIDDESKNISFLKALFRYILKITLGIFSLFVILGDEKGRTIHDNVSGSVVIYKKK